MIDPAAEAKRFITLDEVVQALIDDDPHTRFFADESDGPRTELEGRLLALGTMMHCWFQELRPVVFWHPMVNLTYVARDTSDGLVTAAISVMLNGSHLGYPLNEISDFLRHRTIRWRRVDVALQLARHGVPVPDAVLPVAKRPRTPPPSAEDIDTRAPAALRPDPVAALAVAVPMASQGVRKRAMVASHAARWPTIESDIGGAATNGLAAAAKAGHRGWNEAAALAWAEENGRRLSAPEPGTIDAVMSGGFASRRHTLAR